MKLVKKYAEQVDMFVKVCHRLAKDRYCTSSGGNLAWRLEPDLILITPTQLYKGDIGEKDVVFINMKGETVEGRRKPTGEKPMYLKFFRARPDIVTVIHCHPPAVCAVAVMKGKNVLMRPYYPETSIEAGPVPIVPYAEPLTEELAENFAPFLPKYNNFIMENHGLVTMTRMNIYETLQQVELLECSADSILKALSCGDLKEISRKEVANLDKTMKTRHLPLMGAPGVNKSLTDLFFDK